MAAFCPTQDVGEPDIVAETGAGGITLIVACAEHKLTSVTVTVICPAPALEKSKVLTPGVSVPPVVLLSTVNVYAPVPPAAVNVPEPFVPLAHVRLKSAEVEIVNAGG